MASPDRPLAALLFALAVAVGGCEAGWQGAPHGGDAPVDPDGPDEVDPLDADGDGVPWPEDCHDGEAAIFPGADELCDGLDNDCSGAADDVDDEDGDGFDACADCDDDDPERHPDAVELCGDGLDEDCDGAVDEDAGTDEDGDGFAPCEGDCDDGDAATFPGAPGDEEGGPDGVDDDCDGLTDEGWELPATDGELWVASELYFGLLTGSATADLSISDALAPFTPPASDLVALSLDPTSDVRGLLARDAEGDWGWRPDATPASTSCWRDGESFVCERLPVLPIPLPGLDPLVLHDVVLSGELYAGSDSLYAGAVDAVLRPDEIPALPTPSGSLADLLALRPFDVDVDGDGTDDAWSVLFAFTTL